MNHLDQIINLKVKLITLLDESITGFVYACSDSQEVLALRITNNTGKNHNNPKPETFKFVNTQFIKSIQVLPPFPKKDGKNAAQNNNQLSIAHKISIKDIEKKLNKSIAAYGDGIKKHKPSTSPIAQKIFEKFSQKYGADNVRWQGSDNIILFNEVRSSKPYTLSKGNLTPLHNNPKHLEQVQKTLKEIWLEVDNEKRGG